ncbi:MAG: anthranilate phosphoribosyltransferase [Thermoguttaceae bacterium]|nr:anthranilate phosphoribosyltransferase [Thermoguttaceae bacterium]MDO4424762.1 anthranilate phosphoribosyltransferase [Planctomycetia bacterium]
MSTSVITQNAVREIIAGHDLDRETIHAVMKDILNGYANEVQISSFLSTLQMKGETVEEITGSAEAMREHSRHISPDFDVMDIAGTGCQVPNKMCISTMASFVVAAAGIPVSKHGNHAVQSESVSGELLEALGMNLNIPPHIALESLKHFKFSFLFAQKYHLACHAVNVVRRILGIPTLFNLLGPLSNPFDAQQLVLGVHSPELVEPLAKVLVNLGIKRGIVIHGLDGLDEATITDQTKICEVREDGTLTLGMIQPEDFGLKRAALDEIQVGSPEENARITWSVLSGKERGAKRDITALNAGIALYVAGKADSISKGVSIAFSILASGEAETLLRALIRETQKFDRTYDFV